MPGRHSVPSVPGMTSVIRRGSLASSVWALALALNVALMPSVAASDSSGAAFAGPTRGVRYYVSLGDSLADSAQPNGDVTHGYAEQLHRAVTVEIPRLRLNKLGLRW